MTHRADAVVPDPEVRHLRRLTSLRAFAALAVFAYHLGKETSWLPLSLRPWVSHGFVGVAFFFVLSGVVLTWSTDPARANSDFWLKRVARVYPSHLFMAFVAIVVPVTARSFHAGGALANVFLVQSWFPSWDVVFSLNAVSWSLSCEAFFYLCTPFLLRWARRRSLPEVALAFVSWALLTAAVSTAMGLAGNRTDVYAYTNPLLRSGEFTLGVLLALALQRGWRPRVPLVPAIGVTVVANLLVARLGLSQAVSDVAMTPWFVLLILAAATADLAGRRGVLQHRWLVYAGEVSFGFYLVHELTVLAMSDRFPVAGGRLGELGLGAATLALACLFAVALHEIVEKPCQRRIRGLASARRTPEHEREPGTSHFAGAQRS